MTGNHHLPAPKVRQRLMLEIEQKNRKIDELEVELSRAHQLNQVLDRRLHEFLTSSTWRMTGVLRKLLQLLPNRARFFARRVLGTTYRLLMRLPQNGQVQRVLNVSSRTGARQRETENNKEYEFWTREFDTLSDTDRARIRSSIDRLTTKPRISVIVPIYETPEVILRETIDSVVMQLYPNWELCLADDASQAPHIRAIIDAYAANDPRIKPVYRPINGHISAASNSALAIAAGDYIALLDHDDTLSEHALYMIADAIEKNPTADILYSDEDKLDADGIRCDPHFKPDWNPELFFGQNYLNHLTVYRRKIIERVGGFRIGYEGSQDYDLALRVIAATTGPIVHIPHILYHWRIFQGAVTMSSGNLNQAVTAARTALTDYFRGHGQSVEINDVLGSFHSVVRPDPVAWPVISVVIPTRDHLDVLEIVIQGLLDKTDYPHLEIIIADNDSVEAQTLGYFASALDSRITIVKCSGPFNYSAINNVAIAQSSGKLVLLLNNDISMIEPDWLKEMARYFSDPTIGVVGAKLLYPDGLLQHAGVVLGLGGVAGHRYVNLPGTETGQFGRLALAQDVSCVTGACLLIRRSVFDELGGLDAENLSVAFNDVDLCIRVREAGYRIIWTPRAVLFHHESRSRGLDLTGDKRARFEAEVGYMIRKWGNKLRTDPFFSPNLSLNTTTPHLAVPPRQQRPWNQHNATRL